MNLLSSFTAQREADRRARIYRELLHREARLGGEIFGPLQPGGRREFFCLDQHTWIWHEEWTDAQTGQPKVLTTRYELRPDGVLKVQDNQNYRYIDIHEARRLYQAINTYKQRVASEVYGLSI